MRHNAARAEARGLNYWPFVETAPGQGRGLLSKLAARACLVVTDDFPCFIVPAQTRALARRVDVPVFAVDGNSVVPLSLLGPPVSAAAHLRPRLHRAFAEAFAHRSAARPRLPQVARRRVEPPFETWKARDAAAFVDGLPLGGTVPAVHGAVGGTRAARARLRTFVAKGLRGYAEERSEPRAPADGHGSGLSPHLHFGHISMEEVVETVLAEADGGGVPRLRPEHRGRRHGFFGDDADVNAFLDQALTWRDVGLHWHWWRGADAASLETALPGWALRTLGAHARDPRAHLYTLEELEAGATHDPLWNAAQRELVATGTIHNCLRMLWGKKVLEWSASPAAAYRALEHLNNKYALDGRDPNSYTGILWCFGLFDRPWAPERAVFGSVRYMSSDNTARKFDLRSCHAHVAGLPAIAAVRSDGD
jgi:deoxyribodipyrimidine photo-lyase